MSTDLTGLQEDQRGGRGEAIFLLSPPLSGGCFSHLVDERTTGSLQFEGAWWLKEMMHRWCVSGICKCLGCFWEDSQIPPDRMLSIGL